MIANSDHLLDGSTHLVDILLEEGRLIRGLCSIQILLLQQLLDVVLFLLQNLLWRQREKSRKGAQIRIQ